MQTTKNIGGLIDGKSNERTKTVANIKTYRLQDLPNLKDLVNLTNG